MFSTAPSGCFPERKEGELDRGTYKGIERQTVFTYAHIHSHQQFIFLILAQPITHFHKQRNKTQRNNTKGKDYKGKQTNIFIHWVKTARDNFRCISPS